MVLVNDPAAAHAVASNRNGWLEAINPNREDPMSIFGSIVSAIFGHPSAKGTTAAAGSSTASPTSTAAPSAAGATGKPMTRAKVEVVIKQIADGQREKLNWKESIVDLMKLLNLD